MKRYVKLTYRGRAYPTPEGARAHMMAVLASYGIDVPDEAIIAEEETPGAICPWGAYALVPHSKLPDTLRLGS